MTYTSISSTPKLSAYLPPNFSPGQQDGNRVAYNFKPFGGQANYMPTLNKLTGSDNVNPTNLRAAIHKEKTDAYNPEVSLGQKIKDAEQAAVFKCNMKVLEGKE